MIRRIVRGAATGPVVKTGQPINFLGAVDKKTGVIRDPSHDLCGVSVRGSVLVFPRGTGSSVGAYTIYSLKSAGSAPRAMVCLEADSVVASGCALAGIPLVIVTPEEFEAIRDGAEYTLPPGGSG